MSFVVSSNYQDFSFADIYLFIIIILTIFFWELILGVPVIFFLLKFKLNSWSVYILTGALLAFFVAVILDLPNINFHRWQYYLISTISGLLMSIVARFLLVDRGRVA